MARQAGILTGADYLRVIFASILREPFARTPYIFLFGPENSGKSILHESFELLVTKGVVKADRALTNQSDFNGELNGAVLCVVEEKDVRKSPGAAAKIKDAVTVLKLSIRRMYADPFEVPNYTHWIQCANHQDACPRLPGDTRIQPLNVGPLKREIPKTELLARLSAEGPAMMHTLMSITFPKRTGRLVVPIVETQASRKLAERNMDDRLQYLVEFVREKGEWEGTAAALSTLVHSQQKLPADIRPLRRFLDSNEFTLVGAGVTFSEKPTTNDKDTKVIRFTASAPK